MRCIDDPADHRDHRIKPEFFELGDHDVISEAFDWRVSEDDGYVYFAEYMEDKHPFTPYAIVPVTISADNTTYTVLIWNPTEETSDEHITDPLYEIAHRRHIIMHREIEIVTALVNQRFVRLDLQKIDTLEADSTAEQLTVTWNELVADDSVLTLDIDGTADRLIAEAKKVFELDHVITT